MYCACLACYGQVLTYPAIMKVTFKLGNLWRLLCHSKKYGLSSRVARTFPLAVRNTDMNSWRRLAEMDGSIPRSGKFSVTDAGWFASGGMRSMNTASLYARRTGTGHSTIGKKET